MARDLLYLLDRQGSNRTEGREQYRKVIPCVKDESFEARRYSVHKGARERGGESASRYVEYGAWREKVICTCLRSTYSVAAHLHIFREPQQASVQPSWRTSLPVTPVQADGQHFHPEQGRTCVTPS